MVFFVCNNCGDSMKKNKVETHIYKCRGITSVSCVDCNKDFDLKSYHSHNQCLQEDEKYGGLNYQRKENEAKGKRKQEMWIQKIQEASQRADVPPHIKKHLRTILNYDNIPRKKPKFVNFIRNSIHGLRNDVIDQLWSIFEAAIRTDSQQSIAKNEENNKRKCEENDQSLNENESKEEKLNKTKKIKKEEGSEEAINGIEKEQIDKSEEKAENEQTDEINEKPSKIKFKFMKWAKSLLREQPDCQMKTKKFLKKVRNCYAEQKGLELTEEAFVQKMHNTIEKSSKFV
ncbi:Cell growth-regulating nucleolar protein-like protein [Dinothrombium tinctorium]|nr:Cell growth-regulating nucleolar protein-like protein [Dinothrombium tinctorium]